MKGTWDKGGGSWTNFALTPTSVTLTVTDVISGTGTQEDPYIVEAGGSFILSASDVTFSPDDPDMGVRYAFGTSASETPEGEESTFEQTSSYKSASVYVKTKSACTPPLIST